MGGEHDLENLVTLCTDCHAQLHRVDDVSCVHAGAGPTAVGATFESLPGPIGTMVARIVDSFAVALFTAVAASTIVFSIPGVTLTETFEPVWSLLTELQQTDGVTVAWVGGALCVQLLLAIQPLLRRLRPGTGLTPPVGSWRQWTLGSSVVTAVALGGMALEAAVIFEPPIAFSPQSWVYVYALGSGLVVMTVGATVVWGETDANPTTRWRRLCLVLSTGIVASIALGVSMNLTPGFVAPLLLGLVAARRWMPEV